MESANETGIPVDSMQKSEPVNESRKRKVEDQAEETDQEFKKIRLIVEDYLVDPSGALIPVNVLEEAGSDLLQALEMGPLITETTPLIGDSYHHHSAEDDCRTSPACNETRHDPDYQPDEESDSQTDFDDDDVNSEFEEENFFEEMAHQQVARTSETSREAIRSEGI